MILLVIPSVPFLAFAFLRLFGVGGNRYIVAAIALTPYVAAVGLVLGVIGLLMRRWVFGGIVMGVALITAAAVAPRMISHSQPEAHGPKLAVMSANMYFGQADPIAIVTMVRDNNVDALSLQELTPDAVDRLHRAGLNALLPYQLFQPLSGGSGSGLASKYPLTQEEITPPAVMAQPAAVIDLPGLIDPDIQVVHALPGVIDAVIWKQELDRLPPPAFKVRPRLLVGDFNGTLDHPGLRKLTDLGYVDAAERRGAGLTPTWPAGLWPPPVTIDHVFVDNRAAIDDYRVVDLPGSDHRAVLAWITLPN
ncbi:endonuclease/exonuclease/phosphatase family metal-dependent hydrolase [Actinocrispum wychmicini]|uniref:Endonuclease/exonuclease/phosphatase family metal-dependent hydrolase n=2 Tax=Actinocrispum wychmicini TaxID=1213861 RepID=A0A4R2JLR6_9PSEU|nr:endonuclease/exonuclease/phosphatase family metal-dependent hydrolase [Actinocrispum wychmicini]